MFLIRPEARFSPQKPSLANARSWRRLTYKLAHNVHLTLVSPHTTRRRRAARRWRLARAILTHGIVVVGIVVDNELHRLDDASNDAVAAVVAGAGEADWFVTISGERGADGRVSIDRIDPATDSEEEGTSSSSLSCWPNCGGPGYGKPRATDSIVEKKPPVINGQ